MDFYEKKYIVHYGKRELRRDYFLDIRNDEFQRKSKKMCFISMILKTLMIHLIVNDIIISSTKEEWSIF